MPRKRKKARAEIIEERSQALVERLYSKRELRIIRKVIAWMENATWEWVKEGGGYPDTVFDFISGHVLVATTDPGKEDELPDLHAYTYDEILEKYQEMKESRGEEREPGKKESVYMLLLEVGLH
jgi:uncharacterized membrane-anchored protein